MGRRTGTGRRWWGRGAVRGAGAALVLATGVLSPAAAAGQLLDFRFVRIDMSGGAVWPSDSRAGVVFGARVGLADLFGRRLRGGLELDWWRAERAGVDLAVRDAAGGLAVWWELAGRVAVRPYLGLAAALHSLDTSPREGGGASGQDPASSGPRGLRFGGGGFAGLAFRLTSTGAIRLVAEYRYVAVSGAGNHQVRVGIGLAGSGG